VMISEFDWATFGHFRPFCTRVLCFRERMAMYLWE